MRNPWGNALGYDGPWSKGSGMWTKEFENEADDMKGDNDGVLFVPLNVFRDNFVDLTINHYADDWKTDLLQGDEKVFDVDY